MPRGKKGRSEKQKNDQRKRTALNQMRRYEKLLRDLPNSKNNEKWKTLVNFYSQLL